MRYSLLAVSTSSRAPQGARGLKFFTCSPLPRDTRRAPQGARGLKSSLPDICTMVLGSRPARGAWVEILLLVGRLSTLGSRPARGAWVEIFPASVPHSGGTRRAPQGARGLKSYLRPTKRNRLRRAPQGARGLKCPTSGGDTFDSGRAPQGARGLKSDYIVLLRSGRKSRPARGAWVEIPLIRMSASLAAVAPRKGRVG